MKKCGEPEYEKIPLGQRFDLCRTQGCGNPAAWVCRTTVWSYNPTVFDNRCDSHVPEYAIKVHVGEAASA